MTTYNLFLGLGFAPQYNKNYQNLNFVFGELKTFFWILINKNIIEGNNKFNSKTIVINFTNYYSRKLIKHFSNLKLVSKKLW